MDENQTESCAKCKKKCVMSSKPKEGDQFGCPCDGCKIFLCRQCSGITTTEIRAVSLLQRSIVYLCTDCSMALKELPALKKQVVLLTKEMDRIKKIVEKNQNVPSFADIVKSVNTNVEEKLAKLDEKVVSVNKSMEEKLAIVKQTAADSKNSFAEKWEQVEPTIQELQERENRTKNLLIFGMKEIEANSREGRSTQEISKVKALIHDIDEAVSFQNIKTFRLGAYNAEKVRPIKVIMENKEDVLKILKKKASIQGDCYIKNDQTPSQRAYLKNIVKDLQTRTTNGEKDLKIRYIMGIPKIVKIPENRQSKNLV